MEKMNGEHPLQWVLGLSYSRHPTGFAGRQHHPVESAEKRQPWGCHHNRWGSGPSILPRSQQGDLEQVTRRPDPPTWLGLVYLIPPARVPRASPGHQDARDVRSKGLAHLPAAHIGDAVEGQAHEGGVSTGQVILDGIVDQADQLAVGVHQHRNEEISLGSERRENRQLVTTKADVGPEVPGGPEQRHSRPQAVLQGVVPWRTRLSVF